MKFKVVLKLILYLLLFFQSNFKLPNMTWNDLQQIYIYLDSVNYLRSEIYFNSKNLHMSLLKMQKI